MTRRFAAGLEALAAEKGGVVRFARGERKADVTKARLRDWDSGEGAQGI